MVFCRLLCTVMLHKLDEENQARIVQCHFFRMKHINMWEIIDQNDCEGQHGSYISRNKPRIISDTPQVALYK